MKKTILIFVLFLNTISIAQKNNKQNDTFTNKKGSKYKFTMIKDLDATPIENQGNTGTCWSFSALSFFESELIRLGVEKEILSEMYIVRNAYMGKAEKYIRMDGNSNFNQGGAFHDIPWVIRKYGIMPFSAYNGLAGDKKYNHSELISVLKGAMDGLLKYIKKNNRISTKWQSSIFGILNAYLGYLPQNVEDIKFKVKGKEYNPITYRDHIGLNMNDYVSLTSLSNHPFYKQCVIAVPDNWASGISYNIPLNEFTKVMKHAIKNGYTFAWGSDISEDYFSFRNSLAVLPENKETIIIDIEGKNNKNFSNAGSEKKSSCFLEPVSEKTVTQQMRQVAYDNKETTDDHGMHVTGILKDQNGSIYYKVKNSWGTKYNEHDGYFFASEPFMQYKTINILLHKDAIPIKIRKQLGIK